MQVEFTAKIAQLLKREGISVALDTCCFGEKYDLLQLAACCDLILVDIKLMDERRHIYHTGRGNKIIIDNILSLAEAMRKDGRKNLYIRTPIVPGCTDDAENIVACGRFIAKHLIDVTLRWDLILFHDMCKDKYSQLRMPWKHEKTGLVTRERAYVVKKNALLCAVPSDIVHILGLSIKKEG
jgi:pyruvate formate lyase activating enzyme